MKKPLILIVEDDPGMLEYFDRIVRDGGWETSRAADGDQALASIRERKPDAAVLDLMLPRRGGYELLSELKKEAGDLPLIVVTAYFTSDLDRSRIMKHPCVKTLLPKPVTPELLTASLREALAGRPKNR
jgi:CheY-like chemotaxis protein